MGADGAKQSRVQIWHQSYADLATLPHYREWILGHGQQILGTGASLSIHGLAAGSISAGDRGSYLARLKDLQVADAAIKAADAGFDAVAVGCIYDPGLEAARSVVEIPVLGMAESVLGHAAAVGARFGLVSPSAADALIVDQMVESYGMRSRVAASVVLDPPLTEPEMDQLGGARAAACVEAFLAACDSCQRLGAELVIPTEGVLAEFLFSREQRPQHSLPVVDPLAVLWQRTRASVEMRRTLGRSAGQRITADRADVQQVRRAAQEGWSSP